MRTRRHGDPWVLVGATSIVASAFFLTNCGDESTGGGGSGGDGTGGQDSGGQPIGGQATGGQASGGQASGGAGGSGTMTGQNTLTYTGTGTCYNDNVVTNPPPLPAGYPACEYGMCDNPTGTLVDGDIYYEPSIIGPADNGACCGFPMGPYNPGPGGLNCDKNTVYLDDQDNCVILEGTIYSPMCNN